MNRPLQLCVILLSVLVFDANCYGQRQRCRRYPGKEDLAACSTCDLYRPREVTLIARNVLKEPNFEETVTLTCTRQRTLFFILQEAADLNPAFRFTATYFGSTLGFFIDAINNVAGTFDEDQSFWEILDGNLDQTDVGASSFQPRAGETVTFNLTMAGHDEV